MMSECILKMEIKMYNFKEFFIAFSFYERVTRIYIFKIYFNYFIFNEVLRYSLK